MPDGGIVDRCPNCKEHPFQDERYGEGKRVMNKCAKGFRCTVCGNVKQVAHK